MRSGGSENRGDYERSRGWPDRLVSVFGSLVPEERRDDWVREWQAELDAARIESASGGRAWRVASRLAAAAEDAVRFRDPGRFRLRRIEWLAAR
jgi:hypothetical protein